MPSGYDPETLAVGVFGRPHGVTGELHFRPHNRAGRVLEGVKTFSAVTADRTIACTVTALRPIADGYLVRLAGVNDRDAAAALTLAEVRVPRRVLPPLAPGEYYVEDVVGCTVEGEDGQPLGQVRATFWNGAHDVATIADAAGRERMIPLVPDFVLSVDAAGRKMKVRWEDVDE